MASIFHENLCDGSGAHHSPQQKRWLSASEAQDRLGCDLVALGRLVTEGTVHAFQMTGQEVVFRIDELDAVPVLLTAQEALRRMSASGFDSTSASNTSGHVHGATVAPSDDPRPLKEAAGILGMPYKTLLRLAAEGAVPAVDLNAHRGRRRPRYVVSIAAVRQHLKVQAEKQAVQRRAPQPGIDLRRLAQPQRGPR